MSVDRVLPVTEDEWRAELQRFRIKDTETVLRFWSQLARDQKSWDEMDEHLAGIASTDAIKMLLRAHYHMMSDPQFWYKKHLQEASSILCVRASDIRAGKT